MRRNGLWHEPDFLKLWGGQAVSHMGSSITDVGLPLTAVLMLGASPQTGQKRQESSAPMGGTMHDQPEPTEEEE